MKPAVAEFRVSLAAIRKQRGRQEPPATDSGREGAQRVSSKTYWIIGAGANGLSTGAHLRALGVSHRIVGRPMNSWKSHMPGWHDHALGALRLRDRVAQAGLRPGDLQQAARARPTATGSASCRPWAHFLAYADWWTDQLVPDVEDLTVTDVSPVNGGFR